MFSLSIFTLFHQKWPETPAFHQAPWGSLAMNYSFFFDAKHFESERKSVSSWGFFGPWLSRWGAGLSDMWYVIIESVCFGVWSSSGAAQKSCPGWLFAVHERCWSRDLVALVNCSVRSRSYGTHGHDEKKNQTNTLEGLFLFSFSNWSCIFCQDAQEQGLHSTGTPTWS